MEAVIPLPLFDLRYRDRFVANIVEVASTGCWIWTGNKTKGDYVAGYGTATTPRGRTIAAHRIAYAMFAGPIAFDQELHHLCHNRACVNPAHLKPMTRADHMKVDHIGRYKTRCVRGHSFNPPNGFIRPNGVKGCQACDRILERRKRQRLRANPPAPVVHGSRSTYVRSRCRCTPCREANSAYMRTYKARRVPSEWINGSATPDDEGMPA